MRSLKRYINQFKEELAQLRAQGGKPNISGSNNGTKRRILTKSQMENTREKLHGLESMYARHETEPTVDEHSREVELESLKRLINQLKEEMRGTSGTSL